MQKAKKRKGEEFDSSDWFKFTPGIKKTGFKPRLHSVSNSKHKPGLRVDLGLDKSNLSVTDLLLSRDI